LNRKSSPEKRFTEVRDFSSSKVPLELAAVAPSAAVTLPPSAEDESRAGRLRDMAPKNVEDEDALFEERDFGSVPTVRIPASAPPEAWNPAKAPKPHRFNLKMLRDVDIFSILSLLPDIDDHSHSGSLPVTIFISGMASPKVRNMTKTPGHGGPRSQHPRSGHVKPRRQRDTSGSHGQKKPAHSSAQPSAMQTGSNQTTRPKNGGNSAFSRRVSQAAQ
jgi:hypothetical protein